MTRRCSYCSNNGHNSRTCISKGNGSCGGVSGGAVGGGSGGGDGVKIFGVRLTENSIIKKSASMGNLSHYHSSSSAAASPNPSSPSADPLPDPIHVREGYLSDDPAHAACSTNRRCDRKKGVPWTEEEHRKFLMGLQKLGKGDWRGIARHFVGSRTPTQVASHAQKHFIRQSNAPRRKRRSSLFDMASEAFEIGENDEPNPSDPYESEPMDAISQETVKEDEDEQQQTLVPAFFPAYIPIPIPIQMWAPHVGASHEVVKPIAAVPKEPVNVDEVVGLSELSLGEIENDLSLKLRGSSRPSAFHVNNTAVGNGSDVNDNKSNAIQAA